MAPRTLQLPAETDFHRRAWRVQRISFAVLAAIVAAALLGAFGSGPLSRARQSDGRGLSLQYERFARAEARTTLDLRLAATAAASGTQELLLGGAWLDDLRIQSIEPPPRETHTVNDGLRYRFDVQGGTDLHVRIEAQPIRPGRIELQVGQPGVAPLRVTQFVFP